MDGVGQSVVDRLGGTALSAYVWIKCSCLFNSLHRPVCRSTDYAPCAAMHVDQLG